MTTLDSKPLVSPCSSTFNHSLSSNNQLPSITCRGNSIAHDDTHAPGSYSHSPFYTAGSSSIIHSGDVNQVASDCVRTSRAHEKVCGGISKINSAAVCKFNSVKKAAVSVPSCISSNDASDIVNNDDDHNHDDGYASTSMLPASVVPEDMRNHNHVRKTAATSTVESNKIKATKHRHDCAHAGMGAQMFITSTPINSDTTTNEAAGIIKKPNANVPTANTMFESFEHEYGCGIRARAHSRCRSQRTCRMLQSPSSLDVQKSFCDMKSNSIVNGDLHGWLEAMRETSPPRTRSPTCTTNGPAASSAANSFTTIAACTSSVNNHTNAESGEDLQLLHRAWMAKHPSALDKLEEIVQAASGKRVAVFLDYDGTLSPIVENPDRAFMSHQMRAIVKDVANVFPTAIISGRCKEKLHEFVQLPELYYAGSHGMEILGPARPHHSYDTRCLDEKGKEAVVLFQPAKEFTLVIDQVFKILEENTKDVPGARVENNKFCVSVHFRCVKERHWIALAEQVHQVIQSYPNLCLTQGRKVLEIRPLIPWNKGKALDFLLKALGLGDQNTVFPIYLGDDRSDEDAFKVLNRKKHGLGILVTTTAKETNAVCSLRDPSEVGELLTRLVKWKRRHLNDCM